MVPSSIIISAAVALVVRSAWGQTQPRSVPKECATANVTEQDVAREIFAKYGNWQRPVRNVRDPVVVNITLALSAINDVIERQRILSVTGYISVRWFDQLRVWNNTFPLNCVTYVVLGANNVWLPDIAAMNAEGRYTLMQLTGEKVRVYSDGYTIYSPGGTFSVFCDFDCTYFPFDEQHCAIKFESWRYTHPFMEFRFFAPTVKIYQWSENGQWSLISTNQSLVGLSYFDPENSFDRVEFYVHLKRKSAYYLTSIVIPCAIILVAQFSIFALPVDEVQKLAILFTCLLSYLVFELMVMGDMPRSSDHVPLLTKYLDISMALISFSILGECLVFALLRRARTMHPEGPGFVGPWLRTFTIIAARLLCARLHFPHYKSDSKNNQVGTTDEDTCEAQPANGNKNGNHMKNGKNTQTALYAVSNGHFTTLALEPISSSSINSNSEYNRNRSMAPHIDIAKMQWQIVANVVDRITLIIYVVANITIPVVMFVILPYS